MPPLYARNKLIDIEGELVNPYETEKAWRFYDGKTTVWLAKSQVEFDAESKTMTMPQLLADEKGLV